MAKTKKGKTVKVPGFAAIGLACGDPFIGPVSTYGNNGNYIYAKDAKAEARKFMSHKGLDLVRRCIVLVKV